MVTTKNKTKNKFIKKTKNLNIHLESTDQNTRDHNLTGAREKITHAATVLFALHGLDGVTIRDIAKESGLNLSLISYYFGGKEKLYVEIVRDFAQKVLSRFQQLTTQFEKEALTAESLRRQIDAVVDTIIDLRADHPQMIAILEHEKNAGLPYTKEIHESIFRLAGEQISSLIERGQQKGIVRDTVNPHFFMFCVIELVTGYFVMQNCQTSLLDKCYTMPQDRLGFRNQISLLLLNGVLKN